MLRQKNTSITQAFLILLVLLLCACGKTVPPVAPPAPEPVEKTTPKKEPKKTSGEIFWEKYLQSYDIPTQPFRTQLTLRYGREGETDRVNGLLWGNDEKEMRLDLSAGVGVTGAKIYDGPRQFVVFMPQKKRAYRYVGTEKPLFSVGVPMPLGLAHLSLLISGHNAKVFGEIYAENIPLKQANISKDILADLPKNAEAYILGNAAFAGTLVLDAKGLPHYWQAEDNDGWNMEFNYKNKQKLPFRIIITHGATKQKALLLIKEREKDVKTFTGVKLKLILPRNTPISPLEDLGKD